MCEKKETIAQRLDRAAKLIGGKAWGADKLRSRIYMDAGRKDAKAFFEYPEASYTDAGQFADVVHSLGGHVFRVFIDDCGQAPKWYSGQKRKIMESFRRHALALLAFDEGAEDLAGEIMAGDVVDDDEAYNEVSNHLINGRAAEARAVLSPWLDGE